MHHRPLGGSFFGMGVSQHFFIKLMEMKNMAGEGDVSSWSNDAFATAK
jgi:hypothetical protein